MLRYFSISQIAASSSFPSALTVISSPLASPKVIIPNYIKEGKNQLVIAVGCTGGKHRSVTVAGALYEKLKEKKELGVKLEHRDIDKDNKRMS